MTVITSSAKVRDPGPGPGVGTRDPKFSKFSKSPKLLNFQNFSGKPSGFVVLRTSVLSCLCLEPHVTGPKSVSHDFPHLIRCSWQPRREACGVTLCARVELFRWTFSLTVSKCSLAISFRSLFSNSLNRRYWQISQCHEPWKLIVIWHLDWVRIKFSWSLRGWSSSF